MDENIENNKNTNNTLLIIILLLIFAALAVLAFLQITNRLDIKERGVISTERNEQSITQETNHETSSENTTGNTEPNLNQNIQNENTEKQDTDNDDKSIQPIIKDIDDTIQKMDSLNLNEAETDYDENSLSDLE